MFNTGRGGRGALPRLPRLYEEVALTADSVTICRSYADIEQARASGKIGILITMEGVEPLGTDLHLLRVFYELGVRSVGPVSYTHLRAHETVLDLVCRLLLEKTIYKKHTHK